MGRNKGGPKTGGRKKGVRNKVTSTTREWIQEILSSNKEQLEQDMSRLEPNERWRIAEKLLAYVIPKMQSVEGNIALNSLTDSQIDEVISRITKDIGDED